MKGLGELMELKLWLSGLVVQSMIAVPCFAQSRKVQVVDSAERFEALTLESLNNSTLHYNEKWLTFSEWEKQFPLERQALVIYPEYSEPVVTTKKNGVTKQSQEKLMVLSVRTKTIVNRPATQIKLKNLISLDSVRKFTRTCDADSGEVIDPIAIQPSQFMGTVAGKGPIQNFQQCNKSGANITRPLREVDLSYTNPKHRSWCNDTSRSLCLESCYLFGRGWREGVSFVNLGMSEAEKKDYGIAMQSEIRYFTAEQEAESPVSLKNLTQLDSPVRGGLEQNIFYLNQVMEFGKMLAVLQEVPGEPAKTVVTTFVVIGIKKRTYNQFSELKKTLHGQSVLFNDKCGITAGLPVFTQDMVNSLIKVLDKS
jgi:hypothetical protein